MVAARELAKKQSQPSNKKVFDIAGAGRLLTAFCF
jgi:hypothetical protein